MKITFKGKTRINRIEVTLYRDINDYSEQAQHELKEGLRFWDVEHECSFSTMAEVKDYIKMCGSNRKYDLIEVSYRVLEL